MTRIIKHYAGNQWLPVSQHDPLPSFVVVFDAGVAMVDGIASGIRTPNRLQRRRNWRRWRTMKRIGGNK